MRPAHATSSPETEQGPTIVVGIDEAGASLPVVRWAAQTAGVHGYSLTIVCAQRGASGNVALEPLKPADNVAGTGLDALAEAAATARSAQPGLAVTARMIGDERAHGLLSYSSEAAMLVLGACTHGEFHDRLFGSPARLCMTRSRAPVALVPSDSHKLMLRPPRLVVGVDDSSAASATLHFALREAEARGFAMHIVHTWTEPIQPPTSSMAMPMPVDLINCRDAAQRILDNAVTLARAAEPTITVTSELTNTAPETALIDASRDARLLIIGRHHHSRLVDLMVGSVCDHVVHNSGCPVIVVPHLEESG